MTTQHTPGPWGYELAGCETSHGLPIIIKSNGHLLAELADRNEANARLIAAAPELLAEAIELLCNATYADGQATVLTRDCEALEATIAKATAA